MSRPDTTSERLARIETLLENKVIPDIAVVREELADIKAKELKDIKDRIDADIKDLAALKSKGGGMLVGVGLAATAFGTVISTRWKEFLAAIS